jgi:predicted  nucleic acid-binding Zn-ribbon protein
MLEISKIKALKEQRQCYFKRKEKKLGIDDFKSHGEPMTIYPSTVQLTGTRILLFLLSALLLFTGQSAAEKSPVTRAPAAKAAPVKNKPDSPRKKLTAIHQSIQERRRHLDELRRQLTLAQTSSEKTELEYEIDELEKLIQNSKDSFEFIATGGVDSSIFRQEPRQKFDWQRDFFEIIEPFMRQLKQLTETPRVMERLSREIAENEDRLKVIKRALSNISSFSAKVKNKALLRLLQSIEQSWQQRRGEVKLELNVLRSRLDNLQKKHESFWTVIHLNLLNFIKGRGMILVLAFLSAGSVWFILQAMYKFKRRNVDIQKSHPRNPYSRLLGYGYQAMSGILAMLALLMVLYTSGDWLLLGIALIILFFIALGSKTYLPRFMSEARLLLNMGPVRVGERVIYKGIPWQVMTLNIFSRLYNPELQGGVVRIPLSDMDAMTSRPDDPDEPWFPTRKDDYVLLNDGTYGRVILQTPEIVQLQNLGSVRNYLTGAFLDTCPRNLSRSGFGCVVTFGIDYQHQAICLKEVPGMLKAAVITALEQSAVGESLESVLVEFKEAGASSLDYLIYVKMNGNAADSYWSVGRIIQQACVNACNERGWIIPFNQITVHQSNG